MGTSSLNIVVCDKTDNLSLDTLDFLSRHQERVNPQPIHVSERIVDRTVRLYRDGKIMAEVSQCTEGRIISR
jgi:hypothetical protein